MLNCHPLRIDRELCLPLDSDEYALEEIARVHHIDTRVFIPFVIARLSEGNEGTSAALNFKLRDVGDDGETQRRLRLVWSKDSRPTQALGVSERTVTEFAACGVACAALARYTLLRLRAVTANGDRFDYWMDDGQREYGLEISGTIADDLEARHRLKVRQLLDNPYGVDGFVIVVGFAIKEVIFSFNRFEEDL
jgi:hypothetical protein